MQLYNNPSQPVITTCPKCHKTFKLGNLMCAVMHYGDGCCHYGDTEIVGKKLPLLEDTKGDTQ